MKWQAVFFDFDGVILDSVDVKTKAFAKMFSHYGPEVERKVVEYHMANGGISRFDKFEHYYKNLLKKPYTQDIQETLGKEFNQLVIGGVLAAPFIDGALDTLKELKQSNIPAFVVSGTPHDEMKTIVNKRNLDPYFEEVHGSPKAKHNIVWDIAGRKGYQMADSLFIGDASSDYEAAKTCGMHFLGIIKKHEKAIFPNTVNVKTKVSLI